MSYLPTAAGHAAREAPRTVEQESLDEHLFERAMKWLETDCRHKLVDEVTKDITTTAANAGLLTIHPQLTQHKEYYFLGMFISELWNQCCPETTIVYPHNTPKTNGLGQYLPPSKTLIIQGTTGQDTGDHAQGPIIITGTTGYNSVWHAKGPVIITGTAGENNGAHTTGPIIALTPLTGDPYWLPKKPITQEQYAQNSALREYVDRLLVFARDDPLAIEQEFGNGVAITKEIKKRIRRRR